MTREVINELKKYTLGRQNTEKVEINVLQLNRIIKALEQEPCGDWYDVSSNEMTLEQARQAVKDLRKKLAEYLEQEPCEDAISRQAVIKCLERGDTLSSIDHRLIDQIKGLPPVNPQLKTGDWIPVSERLPNKPNVYTVTDSKGDVVRFVFNDTESSREYWLRCAKAWMPLPKPFEPQERSGEK